MIYYHNPRCSKSRQGLEILEKSGKNFTVKLYLEEPMSKHELKDVLDKLGQSAMTMIRQKEEEFAPYKEKNLTDEEWMEVLSKTPKLLERPILVSETNAVIGRPPEKLEELL